MVKKQKDLGELMNKELTPREKRIEFAKAKKQKENSKNDSQEQFRQWFVQQKRIKNLDGSLENILWAHFKAMGFDKENKFDEGLKHFGIK